MAVLLEMAPIQLKASAAHSRPTSPSDIYCCERSHLIPHQIHFTGIVTCHFGPQILFLSPTNHNLGMSLATANNLPHFGTAFRSLEDHDDDDDFDDYQSIPGSCIDASKLMALLRMKFGAGSYDMHVSYTHHQS